MPSTPRSVSLASKICEYFSAFASAVSNNHAHLGSRDSEFSEGNESCWPEPLLVFFVLLPICIDTNTNFSDENESFYYVQRRIVSASLLII